MFKKPNLESDAESSAKKNYVCSFCSKSYPTSQSFAGHHNLHRIRHIDRWGLAQEDLTNAGVPAALRGPKDSKRPLSSGSINSGSRNGDEQNSRAVYTFMPTGPSPAPAPARRFWAVPEDDMASGSSTGSTSPNGENSKKREFSGLARLKTGSPDDESWLKL